MPGCSSAQFVSAPDKMSTAFLQRIENTGPKSSSARWDVASARDWGRKLTALEAANSAGRNAAAAWRGRYLEWMETDLPRTSTDLLPRLPFNDSVRLAALVGTGRMTWPEINAALDAMIKLAADGLDGCADEHHAPTGGQSVNQTYESEIWARYHAQCDEVFAKEDLPSAPEDHSQLWATERVLDRLRNVRDRELAVLHRQLAQSLRYSPSAVRLQQEAMPWTKLSPAESKALRKLDATGFVASDGTITAIDRLVREIASSA